MKDYSALSDFEINKDVAKALGAKPYLSDSGDFEKSISYGDEGVFISSKFKLGSFDPCNSWADAGPIIHNNLITITPLTGGKSWQAFCRAGEIEFRDKNPRRAAMIVYLMMKDNENA